MHLLCSPLPNQSQDLEYESLTKVDCAFKVFTKSESSQTLGRVLTLEHWENSILSSGIYVVDFIQKTFQSVDWLIHPMNSLGAPPTSFFLIFPIAYFICPKVGLLIVWITCISEWLNGILKWMLHGQRPYWWSFEHRTQLIDIHLKQFPSTCETGPGSPSGHCMVTAATWYLLVAYLSSGLSRYHSCNVKFIYFVLMSWIGLARCYIASHFPHQVIFGIIGGVCLCLLIERSRLANARFWEYLVAGLFVFLSAVTVHQAVIALGYNPNWSVVLAKHWCEQKYWIHMETNLFFAFARDASMLFGSGVSIWLLKRRFNRAAVDLQLSGRLPLRRTIACLVSCLVSWYLATHSGPIVALLPPSLYLLAALQYAGIPLLVMVGVPMTLGLYTAGPSCKRGPGKGGCQEGGRKAC